MSFATATQAQRDDIVLAVRKVYPLIQPSINSRSLPGVANLPAAEAEALFQELVDALDAAGYTATV